MFKNILIVTLFVSSLTSAVPTPYDEHKEYKLLCLGDSYTVGLNESYSVTWPAALRIEMMKENLKVAAPKVYALPGWTTFDLITVLGRLKPTLKYDFIYIMIGVNNHISGQDINSFHDSIKLLITKAKRFVGGDSSRIYFFSLPDWGATPFGVEKNSLQIRKEIITFNEVIYSETKIKGCGFIDITPTSRKGLADHSYLSVDNLHPSGKMYLEWADIAFEILKRDRGRYSSDVAKLKESGDIVKYY